MELDASPWRKIGKAVTGRAHNSRGERNAAAGSASVWIFWNISHNPGADSGPARLGPRAGVSCGLYPEQLLIAFNIILQACREQLDGNKETGIRIC